MRLVLLGVVILCALVALGAAYANRASAFEDVGDAEALQVAGGCPILLNQGDINCGAWAGVHWKIWESCPWMPNYILQGPTGGYYTTTVGPCRSACGYACGTWTPLALCGY